MKPKMAPLPLESTANHLIAEDSERTSDDVTPHPLPAEVCERMRRDGGSVFPAYANTGDPDGRLRPVR
jgi:hypothetical protein